MIRTFIAIDIEPSAQLRAVLDALAKMGRSVRVVGEAQLHLTLRFLGAIEPEQVAAAEAALRAATVLPGELPGELPGADPAAGARPGELPGAGAFDLRVVGLGAFPTVRRARVVWAGLVDAEPAAALVRRLDSELEARGFPPRDRAWAPHLTLARVKSKPPRELVSLVEQDADAALGRQTVTAVHLYRSELTSQGATHHVMARVEL